MTTGSLVLTNLMALSVLIVSDLLHCRKPNPIYDTWILRSSVGGVCSYGLILSFAWAVSAIEE